MTKLIGGEALFLRSSAENPLGEERLENSTVLLDIPKNNALQGREPMALKSIVYSG